MNYNTRDNNKNKNVENFNLDRFIDVSNGPNFVNNVPAEIISNEEVVIYTKQKRKINGIFLGLLVFLFISLAGVIGWVAGSYLNSKNNDEQNIIFDNFYNEDKVDENVDEKVEENQIKKNEKYSFYKEKTINLHNDKDAFNIVIYYYVDKEFFLDYNDENDLREVEKNVLRRDVFVNNKKIGDTVLVDVYSDSSRTDTYILNDDLTKIKTLKDIGNQSNYLIFTLTDNSSEVDDGVLSIFSFSSFFTYIINSDGNILKIIESNNSGFGLLGIEVPKDKIGDRYYIEDVLDDNYYEGTPTYGTKRYLIYPNDNIVDVHDNYLYFINGGCEGYSEYKLVIKDGVIKEEKIGEFSEDVVAGVGQC